MRKLDYEPKLGVFEAALNRIRRGGGGGRPVRPPIAATSRPPLQQKATPQRHPRFAAFVPKPVSRARFHLENLIARTADYIYFAIDEDQYRLTLIRGRMVEPEKFSLQIDVALDGVPGRLGISDWLEIGEGSTPTKPEHFSTLPPRIQQSMIMLRFGGFIRLLSGVSKPAIKILNASSDRSMSELEPLLRFTLEHRSGAQARCALHGGQALIAPILRLLNQAPIAHREEYLKLLHVVRVRIGSEVFTVREIASLERGDVVTINSRAFKDHGVVQLVVTEAQHLIGKLTGDTIMVEEVSSGVGADSVSQRSVDLAHIEVKVTFEIATKTLSLEELRAIGAGSIVKLDQPPDGLVGVFVNGQRIGVGELVDVDKRMGVRILEMFGRRNG